MTEFIFILSVFSTTSLYSLFSNKLTNKGVIFFLVLTLILIAGFRSETVTLDYDQYLIAYENYASPELRFEPSFKLIAAVVKFVFNDPVYLFLIYAILGVIFKVIAIKRMVYNLTVLSIVLYLCNFYLLHELTQIRAGVASGLMLLSIPYVQKRNWKKFLILFFLAFNFHYTSIVFLAIWFLNTSRFNIKVYLLVIPIAYVLALRGFSLSVFVSLISLEKIQNLLTLYKKKNELLGEGSINIFNSIQILRCLLAYFFMINYKKFFKINEYNVILLKVFIIGVVLFPLFMDFPDIAFRISEFMLIVEIILIPQIINLLPKNKIFKLVPIAIGGLMLYVNLFIVELILIK